MPATDSLENAETGDTADPRLGGHIGLVPP
jgi:hypothetical protein